MNKQLLVSHNGDVFLINLESNAVSQIFSVQFLPKYLAAYKDSFLFTSKHCIYHKIIKSINGDGLPNSLNGPEGSGV